jgi:hypothetical protein
MLAPGTLVGESSKALPGQTGRAGGNNWVITDD